MLVAGLSWPPETFLARLFRSLLDRGVELTIATGPRPEPQWTGLNGFRWLPSRDAEAAAWSRAWRLAGAAAGAARNVPDLHRMWTAWPTGASRKSRRWLATLGKLARADWDVAYFPWNSGATGHLPLFTLGRPIVLSCRGSQITVAPNDPSRPALATGLAQTFAMAAGVHCVSDDILREAVELGLDPTRATVIRPAVDPEYFRPAPERSHPDAPFRVVSVASLGWRKDWETALLTIRHLVGRGVRTHLHAVGSGPERQRVQFTIRDLGLTEHVTLHGRVAPEGVRNLLREADAFLLSSLTEGVSNAALEAMACAVPVVVTNCGGMPEAVTDGVEGFVTPTRSPETMASALEQIARDPALGRQMGDAGRARVLADFDLADQGRAFHEFLLQANERGSPTS